MVYGCRRPANRGFKARGAPSSGWETLKFIFLMLLLAIAAAKHRSPVIQAREAPSHEDILAIACHKGGTGLKDPNMAMIGR